MCAACVIAINDVQLLLLRLLSDNLKYSIQLCTVICRLQHCNLLTNVDRMYHFSLVFQQQFTVCFCLFYFWHTSPFFRSHVVSKSTTNLRKFSIDYLQLANWTWMSRKTVLHPDNALKSKANRFFSRWIWSDNHLELLIPQNTTGFLHKAQHFLFYIIQSICLPFQLCVYWMDIVMLFEWCNIRERVITKNY